MWNEREMPERWCELLRKRMRVEQLRMTIVKHGYLIQDDQLQEVLAEAHRLDAEMLVVMRQTIAEVLAREETSSQSSPRRRGVFSFSGELSAGDSHPAPF